MRRRQLRFLPHPERRPRQAQLRRQLRFLLHPERRPRQARLRRQRRQLARRRARPQRQGRRLHQQALRPRALLPLLPKRIKARPRTSRAVAPNRSNLTRMLRPCLPEPSRTPPTKRFPSSRSMPRHSLWHHRSPSPIKKPGPPPSAAILVARHAAVARCASLPSLIVAQPGKLLTERPVPTAHSAAVSGVTNPQSGGLFFNQCSWLRTASLRPVAACAS
jgi:hypothetical protein